MPDSSQAPGPLAERLGIANINPELLLRALTHRSYAYENGGLPTNERLEFLGDAVLGLIVTDTLYRAHPNLPEGQLAKLRAAVVNMRALAAVARGVDIGVYIKLGRGEETTGGRNKASILADTLEALLGATYVGLGLDTATRLVHNLFDEVIAASAELGAGLDWKTSLQELTATAELGVPEYGVTEAGPDHEKTFAAQVRIAGVSRGAGSGRSKKEAEQQAAEHAWRGIRERMAASDVRPAAVRFESGHAVTNPTATDGGTSSGTVTDGGTSSDAMTSHPATSGSESGS